MSQVELKIFPTIQNEERFIVKEIVSKRTSQDGKIQFEIKWENTWENEERVKELAPKLLEDFLQNKTKDDQEFIEKSSLSRSVTTTLPHNSCSVATTLPHNSVMSKSRKTTGIGINDIISRLQKTQKQELAKHEELTERKTQHNPNALELSEEPKVYDITVGSALHESKSTLTFDNQETYMPKYPMSPPEAMEAKDGFIPRESLSSQYNVISPTLVSPTPQQCSTSSTTLQSLKSNVDNITKLFSTDRVEHHTNIESICMDNTAIRKTGIHLLQPVLSAVLHRCTICTEVFYEESKFKQHMFMHDQVNLLKQDPPKLLKPGTYQCKFCSLLFDDKEKLKLHYSELHEKEYVYTQPLDQLYKCSCALTFVDYNKFVLHHQTHGRREVFILPKKTNESTSSATSTSSSLDNRVKDGKTNQVKGEDVDSVFEENADKSSAMTTLDFQPVNDALLSKTAAASNEGTKLYRCNLCDELFESESDRANHSLIHVNRSSSLDCHICGKQFKHRTNLSTHLVVHSGVKPHQCNICLRRFTQKVNLQRHMHIHDGSRPFTCKFCSKSFTQRANLQRHVLSHTEHPKEELLNALNEIPNESEVNNAINESLNEAMSSIIDVKTAVEKPEFRCDICDKTFAQKVNLQKHMLIHSGSRPFQCYVCGKAFRQRASLQKHYTVHTNGSTSFICQTCNRLFVSRTNLQRHMLVHAVSGSNQCYLCDQKFSTTDNLERHFSEHIEEATPNISLPQKYFEQSTPGQTFRCATCDIVFDSPIIFSQHLQCHQRGFSPDTTPNDLVDITKAYEENQSCPLQCNACGLIFMSVAKLEAHMATHAEGNPNSGSKHAIGVMICTDALIVPQSPPKSLDASTTTNTISEQPVVKQEDGTSTKSPVNRVSRCPVCKDMFSSKAEMREHYSNVHIDTKINQPITSANNIAYQYDTTKGSENPDIEAKHEEITVSGDNWITESEELLIKENEDFIKDNILGGSKEYEMKGRYERGNYSCKICNRVLTYKYSLEKHMLLHAGSFPYKCHLCSKRFTHKANLDKHIVVHNGEKPYSCHICQRPFSQRSNLQRHQLTHTQNRDFICDVCGKRFNHMASLKTHSLIHTGAKPFSCFICSKRFNQKGNLKRHIQTHRSGKRNKVNGLEGENEYSDHVMNTDDVSSFEDLNEFDNESCLEEKMSADESELHDTPSRRSNRNRTKKAMDDYEFGDDDPLPTMIANEEDSFSSRIQPGKQRDRMSSFGDISDEEGILTVVPSDALDEPVSMTMAHKTVSPTTVEHKETFHCDSCSKLFISLASLEAHKRSAHHIVCDACGKRFSQKANLLKHKLIHANKKPFECKTCHKAFRQKANLQRHELIHSKDRKTVNCSVCQKTFRCTWSLKQHMKNHAVESDPNGCSICVKTFKSKDELEEHLEIHTNQLFPCRLCKETFHDQEALLNHTRLHAEVSPSLLKEIESEILAVANTTYADAPMVTIKNSNNSIVVTNDTEIMAN